jgi:hypothetical protein
MKLDLLSAFRVSMCASKETAQVHP